jgi:hypothetical protein
MRRGWIEQARLLQVVDEERQLPERSHCLVRRPLDVNLASERIEVSRLSRRLWCLDDQAAMAA